MSAELASYQQRVRAREIQPGDFLDVVEAKSDIRGPRGGRYRFDGARFESRVEHVDWVDVDGVESDPGTGWRPLRLRGFKIVTRAGRVTLPGNLADIATAIVRRDEGSES